MAAPKKTQRTAKRRKKSDLDKFIADVEKDLKEVERLLAESREIGRRARRKRQSSPKKKTARWR